MSEMSEMSPLWSEGHDLALVVHFLHRPRVGVKTTGQRGRRVGWLLLGHVLTVGTPHRGGGGVSLSGRQFSSL